jgi:hypothetical protein
LVEKQSVFALKRTSIRDGERPQEEQFLCSPAARWFPNPCSLKPNSLLCFRHIFIATWSNALRIHPFPVEQGLLRTIGSRKIPCFAPKTGNSLSGDPFGRTASTTNHSRVLARFGSSVEVRDISVGYRRGFCPSAVSGVIFAVTGSFGVLCLWRPNKFSRWAKGRQGEGEFVDEETAGKRGGECSLERIIR